MKLHYFILLQGLLKYHQTGVLSRSRHNTFLYELVLFANAAVLQNN
jgi:hypothetical protein